MAAGIVGRKILKRIGKVKDARDERKEGHGGEPQSPCLVPLDFVVLFSASIIYLTDSRGKCRSAKKRGLCLPPVDHCPLSTCPLFMKKSIDSYTRPLLFVSSLVNSDVMQPLKK